MAFWASFPQHLSVFLSRVKTRSMARTYFNLVKPSLLLKQNRIRNPLTQKNRPCISWTLIDRSVLNFCWSDQRFLFLIFCMIGLTDGNEVHCSGWKHLSLPKRKPAASTAFSRSNICLCVLLSDSLYGSDRDFLPVQSVHIYGVRIAHGF